MQAKSQLGRLATEAQQRACEDPRRVAPELHWQRDARGWVAGKQARAFTKKRWGVRPDRVVCRPGYTGLFIHGGESERGISWLEFLNGDNRPQGTVFRRLLEDLCGRVGLSIQVNGERPKIWPFTAAGGRFHHYPGYWVCVLPGPEGGGRSVLQYRVLEDGSVAPGLSAGRYWRAPGSVQWYREGGRKTPPPAAEWCELPQVDRDRTYRANRLPLAIESGEPVLFVEGEKDVEAAEELGFVADTNPGGAGKLTADQARRFRGARVAVIPDQDPPGIRGARRSAATLEAAGAEVRVLAPLGGEPGSGFDLTDWVEEERKRAPEDWRDRCREHLLRAVEDAFKQARGLARPRSIEVRDLLNLTLPPREWILEHFIQEKDIAMIYARRGVGKTYAAQAIAWAVVTGGAWLRFEVKKPTGVLYIDGEMPREDLQSRFRSIAESSQVELIKPLRLLSEDLDDQVLPSLATADGQQVVRAELDAIPEIGLVIIDAVTTLCHDANAGESDSKSWDSMQSWLLSLRRRGVASLILHHSGKTGDQRGTSKREDVMTQVIRLDRPQDYRPEEGARFEFRFTKSRGVLGKAARAMEVQLTGGGPRGALEWSYRDLEGSKRERAWGMFEEGLKALDVAEELDVSRATAFRWQKAWRADPGGPGLQEEP